MSSSSSSSSSSPASIATARLRLKERGAPHNTAAYLHLWYHGPPSNPLRSQHDNDIVKYLRAYQPNEEDFRYFQDTGMQTFITFEQQALRKMRILAYRHAGHGLCEAFMKANAIKLPAYIPNIVFVAIDFEGNMEAGGKGIGEFGFATFYTKSLLSGPVIDALHYSLRAHRTRKFCFGKTIRTHAGLLPGVISSLFADLRGTTGRQIVLVGHNLQSELRILDGLGVYLEDIHITGVLDTYEVARLTGSHSGGSLQDMLGRIAVPWRPGSLHCAGNDACYTLKLVLGLLQARFGDPWGRLEEVVRGDVPEPPRLEIKDYQLGKDGDYGWESVVEDGFSLLSL